MCFHIIISGRLFALLIYNGGVFIMISLFINDHEVIFDYLNKAFTFKINNIPNDIKDINSYIAKEFIVIQSDNNFNKYYNFIHV